LAFAWLRLGDLQRAHALFAHSLDGQQAQDNRLGMAQALQGMAALAVATGNLHAAARLDGFVAAYRADVPILLEPADAADQLDFTSFSASLRGQLSEASTEVEQAAGRRMTLPQAVTYALSLPLPAQSETVLDALTPREREITALIARGLSNGDIADALFLSKRTVEKHIAHILSKLGLANRVQVVRWAADHDLTGS
jgi:non-specific serine/threonine protein kinase